MASKEFDQFLGGLQVMKTLSVRCQKIAKNSDENRLVRAFFIAFSWGRVMLLRAGGNPYGIPRKTH